MPVPNWLIVAVVIAFIWFVGRTPRDQHPKSRIFKAVCAIGLIAAICAFGITSWSEVTAPNAPDAATGQVQAWVYRGQTRYVTVGVYHLIRGVTGVFFVSWGIGFAIGITEMIIRKVRGQ